MTKPQKIEGEKKEKQIKYASWWKGMEATLKEVDLISPRLAKEIKHQLLVNWKPL